jgi:hypothetical protein
MRQRDSREEDKEYGRGLGQGSLFWGKLGEEKENEILKERMKLEEQFVLGNSRTVVVGKFGLRG